MVGGGLPLAGGQSANAAWIVSRRAGLVELGDLVKRPIMHQILPGTRILPNLFAAERTTGTHAHHGKQGHHYLRAGVPPGPDRTQPQPTEYQVAGSAGAGWKS